MSLVLYLLDIGYADVNCSSQGSTPLHTALNHKHTKLAISLINMPGIDINQTDQDNHTPLHLACSHNYPDIVRALGNNTSLSRESLNKKDFYGRSALMVAVEWGHVEAVKEMIKIVGVDMETANREGETLEDVARANGFPLLLPLLKNSETVGVEIQSVASETSSTKPLRLDGLGWNQECSV
eukprot:TRINITY_DN45951_c0_g1_i1.p1 TRINITY_DN45951_c0_g1~~TRINITY_DN45951_c0_g1_i1.p1  ORF type:complete len:213 (-),score=59.18 TRINITY_DN45951_c0_g1_i1:18-563(-)